VEKTPTEGFKTITVTEETLKKLEELAEKTHRSVPKVIEHLLETTTQGGSCI
jgi:predicted CopG family antitoxin